MFTHQPWGTVSLISLVPLHPNQTQLPFRGINYCAILLIDYLLIAEKAVVCPLIKKASLLLDELKNYQALSGLNFISKLIGYVAGF